MLNACQSQRLKSFEPTCNDIDQYGNQQDGNQTLHCGALHGYACGYIPNTEGEERSCDLAEAGVACECACQ